MDVSYCRTLAEYDRVLAQRNALLRDLRDRLSASGSEQLSFWDDRLVALGSILTVQRASLVEALDEEARQQNRELSANRERLQVQYSSGIAEHLASPGRQLPFEFEGGVLEEPLDSDQVALLFRQELESLRRREVAAGMSLRGPHRDDLRFVSDGRDLRTYGSRGQQRTAALALKLAEVAVMRTKLREPPLLLLDDVMSELDEARRAALLHLLANVDQAIVTATGSEDFPEAFRSRARHLRVVEGQLEDVDL
jgi:DNA replication and repair protein RecF